MITPGLGSDKGYEVDYDYLGNLYVYGGGYYSGTSPGNFKVAKYDLSGNLKWTFNGSIPIINWQSKGSNGSPGNFLVDKVTSKIYVSQGFENSVGSRIIRLDSFGVYNNYVSVPNISLTEIWEMAFDCKSKSIFCMGGSTSSNQNIGKIDTLGNFFPLNFTGVPTGVYPSGFSQDVVCAALDESQNLFTLIASAVTPSIDNHIFKLNSTYNGTVWNSPTGFISFVESNNKPYFSTYSSNSFNGLDVNAGYLFYYDGFNVAHIVRDGYDIPAILPNKSTCKFGQNCVHDLVKRTDDNIDIMKYQIQSYFEESRPMLKYYNCLNVLKTLPFEKAFPRNLMFHNTY
jgi:hypothetical protein